MTEADFKVQVLSARIGEITAEHAQREADLVVRAQLLAQRVEELEAELKELKADTASAPDTSQPEES